jgi:4a-hydroxytetrahydrobiopterin dehydratase
MGLISIDKVNGYLSKVPGWSIEDNGRSIVKLFEFKDFDWAIIFINEIAELVEKNPHHPDIMLYEQNKVEIRLTTRSLGGLSEKDFEMANAIDSLINKANTETNQETKTQGEKNQSA